MSASVQVLHTPLNQGGNNFTLDDFLVEIEALGRAQGAGDNSRISAAYKLMNMAYAGVVCADDVSKVHEAFRRGRLAEQGVEFKEESSASVQVSKLGVFFKAGRLPFDARDVFERAAELIKERRADPNSPLRGSAYDLLVKVMREQAKKEFASNPLDDEHIRQLLAPDERKAKTELDRVKQALKICERVRDGAKATDTTLADPPCPSAEIDVAIDALTSRVAELATQTNDVATITKLLKAGKLRAAQVAP